MFTIEKMRRFDGKPNTFGNTSLASFDARYGALTFKVLSLFRNSEGEIFVRMPSKFNGAGDRKWLAQMPNDLQDALTDAAVEAYSNAV